jgi:hypothetical protein
MGTYYRFVLGDILIAEGFFSGDEFRVFSPNEELGVSTTSPEEALKVIRLLLPIPCREFIRAVEAQQPLEYEPPSF